MNRILEKHLNSFSNEFGLSKQAPASVFEMFVNYVLISRHYPLPFELEDVSSGGGNDLAIDGVAILANNQLVTSLEEFADIANGSGRLNVHFIFVQAKTSSDFDSAQIGNFGHGVSSFFTEDLSSTPINDMIANAAKIKDSVFDYADKFSKNPQCSLYYVSTGKWNDEAVPKQRLASVEKELRGTGLFSEVSATPVDADRLMRWSSELRNRVERLFECKDYCDIPPIKGVRESFLVIADSNEYLKLITDDEGLLMRAMFYENVRDFQGLNAVNKEIKQTIEDTAISDRFPVLNNGVTIVSRGGRKTGKQFILSDFQIVNGCQTSNVMFLSKRDSGQGVCIPIKIVYTEDSDVIANIVLAANRQTEVRPEAFESIQPFHKKLEEYYSTFVDGARKPYLYYERRSRQYSELGIPHARIINIPQQIRSYVSVVLGCPHQTYRYYSKLLSVHRKVIFQVNHNLTGYFASALLVNRIQLGLVSGIITGLHTKWKYHLAFFIRQQLCDGPPPPATSDRKADAYFGKLIEIMLDERASMAAIQNGAAQLAAIISDLDSDCDFTRDADFSARLGLPKVVGKRNPRSSQKRAEGRIARIITARGYGFLEEGANSWFFHMQDLVDRASWPELREGMSVSFLSSVGPKGPIAKEIRVK